MFRADPQIVQALKTEASSFESMGSTSYVILRGRLNLAVTPWCKTKSYYYQCQFVIKSKNGFSKLKLLPSFICVQGTGCPSHHYEVFSISNALLLFLYGSSNVLTRLNPGMK